MSQTPASDEALKRQFTGGPDERRNGQAFDTLGQIADRPELRHFYQPTQEDLQTHAVESNRRTRRGAHVIIPMREHRSVVRGVLEYLMGRVDPSKIIVVNCNSNDVALGAVEPFIDQGVTLAHHDEVLDWIDWNRLLPIMGLDRRPKEGKGVTMLAGMLAMYILHPKAAAIIQHDADVREVHRYDPLSHLAYPLTRAKSVSSTRYLASKISRPGRGNETTMTARNILSDIARNRRQSPEVREIAAHLAATLREEKWMLTGEFGLYGKVAYNRPFATGYCEETLISLFLRSCIKHTSNGHGDREAVAQVEAGFNRLDDANDARKEFRMMDRISRFLVTYALFGKPITSWSLEDFQRFNEEFGECSDSARIPTIEDGGTAMSGPVILENLVQDRLIPSVKTLCKQGFIDHTKAEAWAARHRR